MDHENNGQLTDDVFHHGFRDERFGASVRLAFEQFFCRQLGGQGQWCQRVHYQVHPQHLNRFQRRVLRHATATDVVGGCVRKVLAVYRQTAKNFRQSWSRRILKISLLFINLHQMGFVAPNFKNLLFWRKIFRNGCFSDNISATQNFKRGQLLSPSYCPCHDATNTQHNYF